jgi:hypothetical protein
VSLKRLDKRTHICYTIIRRAKERKKPKGDKKMKNESDIREWGGYDHSAGKSNRATMAEDNGLRTASYWASWLKNGVIAKDIDAVCTAEEWHHTSGRFNQTNYFSFENIERKKAEIFAHAEKRKSAKCLKIKGTFKWAEFSYSRRRGWQHDGDTVVNGVLTLPSGKVMAEIKTETYTYKKKFEKVLIKGADGIFRKYETPAEKKERELAEKREKKEAEKTKIKQEKNEAKAKELSEKTGVNIFYDGFNFHLDNETLKNPKIKGNKFLVWYGKNLQWEREEKIADISKKYPQNVKDDFLKFEQTFCLSKAGVKKAEKWRAEIKTKVKELDLE